MQLLGGMILMKQKTIGSYAVNIPEPMMKFFFLTFDLSSVFMSEMNNCFLFIYFGIIFDWHFFSETKYLVFS